MYTEEVAPTGKIQEERKEQKKNEERDKGV